MPTLRLHLKIRSDEMLKYYRGEARTVHAIAADGTTVQFPASALQRHVSKDGVIGSFDLVFDSQNKFVDLKRMDSAGEGLDQTA